VAIIIVGVDGCSGHKMATIFSDCSSLAGPHNCGKPVHSNIEASWNVKRICGALDDDYYDVMNRTRLGTKAVPEMTVKFTLRGSCIRSVESIHC